MENKETFIQNAIAYGEALSEGDSKHANLNQKKLCNLYEKMTQSNDISIFLELLNHENESVKYWAAICLLPYEKEIAKKIFKKLKKSPGIISMNATIILDTWDNYNVPQKSD